MTLPTIRTGAQLCCVTGLIFVTTSIAWWWIVYERIWMNSANVRQDIAFCILSSSNTCQFLSALCGNDHLFNIGAYDASLFVIGMFLTAVSGLAGLLRRFINLRED